MPKVYPGLGTKRPKRNKREKKMRRHIDGAFSGSVPGMSKAPKVYDLAMVERLGKIGCGHDEIAAVFGCTIKELLANGEPYIKALERGQRLGKRYLRMYQWKTARHGNVPMLIWLGKQYLGQRDQIVVPVQPQEQDKSEPDYRKLSADDLRQLRDILKKAEPKTNGIPEPEVDAIQ